MEITPGMETGKAKYDVKGKLIPNGRGHTGPRMTRARNVDSIKMGCQCKFQVKQLYYHRDIAEIVYYNPRHENKDNLIVHGEVRPGDRGRFAAQLPTELREWVLDSFQSGLFSNKILSIHRAQVMKLVASGVSPERCHFLRAWDIRNIAKELRKKEYQKHDNDGESVKLWVQANRGDVFYYQELKGCSLTGTVTANNVQFVIGIQNDFQFRMML